MNAHEVITLEDLSELVEGMEHQLTCEDCFVRVLEDQMVYLYPSAQAQNN